MSITLDPATTTVGELAAGIPGATAVFRQHKIDFCCGGSVSLADAAAQRRVDPAVLVTALNALSPSERVVPEASNDLIEHILLQYHEVHRRELPELIRLARRVEAVHATNPAMPAGLASTLEAAFQDLESHLRKEEMILFPAMRNRPDLPWTAPISCMRHEHDTHGMTIATLEALTNSLTLPEGACRTWQALYVGLEKFITDLMEHIHLENNVLFPRFEGR